ncbi:MAG: NGG1p interacting factor NIF3 [Candidatus Omnitrophota bacterium]|jgi:putative NIF3 family GTP cyclohydrolase 1 type 2
MELSKLYRGIVKYGIASDPRKDKSRIKSYSDTAILYGNPRSQVSKILLGIDIEVPEILLADRLRRSQGIDLVVSHHPEGKAFAGLYEVMQLQVDLLVNVGVPVNVAQGLLEERKREVQRRILPANHMRAVDAARLLDIPFLCVHTPADNHVAAYLEKLLRMRQPGKVSDIIDILHEIPEYQQATRRLSGPKIILGNPKRPAGKIFVEMTGGTEGHKDVYDKLYKTGVRTLVSMHLSEEHFKKVKDADLNVVIAGHISSDTLGLNLLFDKLQKDFSFSILECSGFTRVTRNK